MRRMVRSVALGLALVPGLLVGIGVAAGAQAPIGTEVPFVDADGVTHGSIRIAEVGDPFTGADPARPAPDGQRYVGLTVAFSAAADQAFNANPAYVILRATDGHLYAPSYVQRPAEDIVADLQAQTMSPGNVISGFIGYVVPADAVIDEILYTDTTYRAIPLADLVPTAGPVAGSPVDYREDDGTQGQFTITVQDPFVAFDDRYPAPEGMRYVGLEIVANDTGSVPFQLTQNHIYLRDASGNLYYPATVYRPEGVPLPALESQLMGPGDRVSGFIGYTVPVDAPIVAVDLWPSGQRRTTLVDLVGGGPAPTPAAPESPTPVGSAGPVATVAAATALPPASTAPVASPAPASSAGTGQ